MNGASSLIAKHRSPPDDLARYIEVQRVPKTDVSERRVQQE